MESTENIMAQFTMSIAPQNQRKIFQKSFGISVSLPRTESRRHSQYWLHLRARRRDSVRGRLTLMPKLFWKIFLWFWGAMLIVNCAIIFSVLSIRSVSEQNRAQSMMSLQARKAAEIYENRSPRAFSDDLRDFGQTVDMHFSLY